jgi:competence protein ComEC
LLELAFQLSFTATLGLILLYPRVRTMFHGLPRWIGEPAGVTLAVTIATLPVTLAVFQQVSIVSPLAHVLATPLVPLVLLGASVLVVSTWFPPLASIAATACWLPTTVLAEVVRFSGNLPGAALDTGRLPTVAACGLLAALLAWGVWELPDVAGCRAAVRTYAARSSWLVELRLPLALAAVGLVSIVSLLLVRPDGRLHLSNLALRRGEAVLIRTPAGSTALVVHGPVDARELAERVRESLPVWEHTLALAVVLDPADERGLEDTLRQYPAGHVWDASADARLDLGRGAVVDLFAYPRPAVGVGYGETWIPVAGRSE